jgi:hypothetical protein
MNVNVDNWDRSVDLHRERSPPVVSPTESVKDRTVVRIVCVETLQLITCSGKPKTSVMPTCERPTAHWEWKDGESSVYPRSQGLDWRCTILSGGAGPGHILEDPSEG